MADGISYELLRMRTRDAMETTVYLVRHPIARTRLAVRCFAEPTRLDRWCAAERRPEAMVAGFFVRDPYRPLGETRIGGELVHHEPVTAPWGDRRACVHVDGDGAVRLAPRGELAAEPPGDLVLAGPLLVRDGVSAIDGTDREGFSAARRSSTPTSPPRATRAARSASGRTSCSRCAATGGARASTPGSTSPSSRGC